MPRRELCWTAQKATPCGFAHFAAVNSASSCVKPHSQGGARASLSALFCVNPPFPSTVHHQLTPLPALVWDSQLQYGHHNNISNRQVISIPCVIAKQVYHQLNKKFLQNPSNLLNAGNMCTLSFLQSHQSPTACLAGKRMTAGKKAKAIFRPTPWDCE